jgi:uncharacterized membrane protein YdjX (TVP38/TMEM64 family)
VRRSPFRLALLVPLLALGFLLPVREWVVHLLDLAGRAGPAGAALYAAAFVPAALLLLPAAPLAIGAGFAFGPLVGTLVTAAGAMAGATAAFEAGRHIGGDVLRLALARSRRLAPFARALDRAGFEVVVWLRLSPLVPFYLLNYAFGTTGMRGRAYGAASGLALLPGAAVYATIGSALASPEDLSLAASPHRWLAVGAALALTLAAAAGARWRLPRLLGEPEPRPGARGAAHARASSRSPGSEDVARRSRAPCR